MPSRRILSNKELAPIQKNAVNPFDSFNSDTVNLLTRIVSGGSDVVVKGLDVVSTKISQYSDSANLIKPFNNEEEFHNQWTSENVLWKDNGLNFVLPSGQNYGLSYAECKLLTEDYEYLFSGQSNVVRDFSVSFELMSGAPKCIVACINESNFVIDHPVGNTIDGKGTQYSVKISRNLINDNRKRGLTLRLGVVFDPADPYTKVNTLVENENSSYKTFCIIKNISCNLIEDITTTLANTVQPVNGVYANSGIHMTNTLKVTPGVAIKDDVMLQSFAKTYFDKNTTISLKVDEDSSWIKGKAYTKNDFLGTQYAFQMNGTSDASESIAKKICYFDADGYLKVRLNDTVVTGLIDDYQFNPEIDTLLTLDRYTDEKDINGFYVFRSSTAQDRGYFGGRNVIFVYNDGDKDYVVGRIQAPIVSNKVDPFYVSLNPALLPQSFNDRVADGTISNHVKAYLTAGPIKVSGDPKDYNTECVKWAYVVLYYSYFKNPKPNISYIGLLDESDLNDVKYREDYLVLAKVRFVDCHTVDIITYVERQTNALPTANTINYYETCQYPEIWNGDVPATVTDAINALVQISKENDILAKLKHDAYKEVDSTYRLSKLDSNSNVPKTPIIAINEDNHLERRIRHTNTQIVISDINSDSKIVDELSVGDIFLLNTKLNLYLNTSKTWAFDSELKNFGPYDYANSIFTKKYISFNETAPYQFIDKQDGSKITAVDFGYDEDAYLYPTAPSLKKEDGVFVDTDDGSKLDSYILSYDTPFSLVTSAIFKDTFNTVDTNNTLEIILKSLGATVNGEILDSSSVNVLSQHSFVVGTTEQYNQSVEKLGLLLGAIVNGETDDNSLSDILGGYSFELPRHNSILLRLLIIKLGGKFKTYNDNAKYNYLSMLANLATNTSTYSIFDNLEERSERVHIVKDMILKFGGYIEELNSDGVLTKYRSDSGIISNIFSDITYNIDNDPNTVIDVVIERLSDWYQQLVYSKVPTDMNSNENHFSYLKFRGELLTSKKLIHELEKNVADASVTPDNVAIFDNADGKLGDSNIKASTIITRPANVNDSKEGDIPQFLAVDTTNSTRVIATTNISTDKLKDTLSKVEMPNTRENNLVTFANNSGKLQDSGMHISKIPFAQESATENQLIKFGNKTASGQRQINNSSISETRLENQLNKIPTITHKDKVAIFVDNKGTIGESDRTVDDFINQPDVVHKTTTEGFNGAPSLETINDELSGDKGWSGNHYFSKVINGTAFSARWADLAEYYKVPSGVTYPVGTLVKFGNKYYNTNNVEVTDSKAEIVICNAGDECNAVISSSGSNGTAALILNDKESEGSQLIALSGRVKIRVRGTIKKFDYLTLSETYKGVAVAVSDTNTQKVIGRALQSHNPTDPNGEGLILCVSSFTLTGNKQNFKPNKNITVNDIAMFQDENGTIANTGISKTSIILRKRGGEVDSTDPSDGYDTTKNYIPEFAEVNGDGNRLIKNSGIETQRLVKLVNAIPVTSDVNNVVIFDNFEGRMKDSGVDIINVASVSDPANMPQDVIVKFGSVTANGARDLLPVKYNNENLSETILDTLISKIPTSSVPGAVVVFGDNVGSLVDSTKTIDDIESNMVHKKEDEGFNGSPSMDHIIPDGQPGSLSGDKGWSGNHYFKNTIHGTVLKTQYGDLAEWYTTDLPNDSEYALGTLVRFGGDEEITIASEGEVNGVISSEAQAGLQLGNNFKPEGKVSQLVALEGKVRIRVIGSVNKFDYLTLSSIPGIAIATSDCRNKKIIARALESSTDIREKMVLSVTKFDI